VEDTVEEWESVFFGCDVLGGKKRKADLVAGTIDDDVNFSPRAIHELKLAFDSAFDSRVHLDPSCSNQTRKFA
jgi:hypothetical protein